MFNFPFTDFIPKSVLATTFVWGAAHYFVVGPLIANRVVIIDHLPACTAQIKIIANESLALRERDLPVPTIDIGKELAADQLRRLNETPFMQELNRIGGVGALLGLGDTQTGLLEGYEQKKREAQDAYERATNLLRSEAAHSDDSAGSVCECLAAKAIDETKVDWAVFTGTLGFVRAGALVEFDRRLSDLHQDGECVSSSGAGK